MFYSSCDSPIGRIYVAASDKGITNVRIGGAKAAFLQGASAHEDNRRFSRLFGMLEKYFSGEQEDFKVTLDLAGSAFQKKVWRELKGIPYGKTLSYGEVASRVGTPKGARAVGNACGENPVPIIVPCHRVLKGDGSIGGYTGGVWIKKRLLEMEGIL